MRTASERMQRDGSHIDYDSVAELYDLYAATDYDVPFFCAEASRTGGRILELTSGTGRLSIPLIRAGARLTCVDASPGMLAVLSRKLRQQSLTAEVLCADVCELNLPPAFELAILPFQSFMEIVGVERQRMLMRAVYACLQPGGRFICTLHNPSVRRRLVDGVLRLVASVPHDGGSLVVSGMETGGHPLVQRLQLFEFFGADGLLRAKRLLPMQFQFTDYDELEALATGAGFAVLDVFGDYGRSAFDAAASPVMIWVLVKSDAGQKARPQEGGIRQSAAG